MSLIFILCLFFFVPSLTAANFTARTPRVTVATATFANDIDLSSSSILQLDELELSALGICKSSGPLRRSSNGLNLSWCGSGGPENLVSTGTLGTNLTAYSTVTLNTVSASSLSVSGAVDIASASITTFGLMPAFSLACPTAYTRVGINECLPTSGRFELVFSSAPNATGQLAFFTTTTASLQNAKAKSVVLNVTCSFTNNTGTDAGTILYVTAGGLGNSVNADVCYARTLLNLDGTSSFNSKEVLLDSSQQFDYRCLADNSIGSARTCAIFIEKIIQ